jgi:ABC-type sugar transport system permease subunit
MLTYFKKRPFIFFIIPGFVLYTVLIIYPIVSAMQFSLFQWNGIGPKIFVGLGNYIELFSDKRLMDQFINALLNSLKLFGLTVFIQTPLQIIMAYMIYSNMKGHRFTHIAVFAPQIICTPIIVFIFRLLLDVNVGVINNVFELIGLRSWVHPWLGIPKLGVVFMYIMITWGGIGVGMTFFLGAMKMVGSECLEAAYIEGAGFWTRLTRVILPQIKVTVVNLILIAYIYSMTMFDFSYVLGGNTGGVGGSIDTMALFFYRIAFGDSNPIGWKLSENSIGMGTTVACVLFIMIFIIALLQVIFINRGRDTDV